jgi:hypothetical protein
VEAGAREQQLSLQRVHTPRIVTVLVDARNVLRSLWPNLREDEVVEGTRAWAAEERVDAEVVFDGPAPDGGIATGAESADDWIARRAGELDSYWLVTSDRELRERAGGRAERVVGGGAFARLVRDRLSR